jgi:hypothetical protein
MKLIHIKPSTRKGKKLMARFEISKNKFKTVHFGQAGASDYTKHKDAARKERYISRHQKRENWDNPLTAGALSRFVIWNKPTLRASIADYKKRFKL